MVVSELVLEHSLVESLTGSEAGTVPSASSASLFDFCFDTLLTDNW